MSVVVGDVVFMRVSEVVARMWQAVLMYMRMCGDAMLTTQLPNDVFAHSWVSFTEFGASVGNQGSNNTKYLASFIYADVIVSAFLLSSVCSTAEASICSTAEASMTCMARTPSQFDSLRALVDNVSRLLVNRMRPAMRGQS